MPVSFFGKLLLNSVVFFLVRLVSIPLRSFYELALFTGLVCWDRFLGLAVCVWCGCGGMRGR